MRVECLPASQAKLKGKRVLVVEDEALVAMMVEDELLGAGAEVVGPGFSVGGALRLVEAAEAGGGGIDAAVLDIDIRGEAVVPVADMLAALGVPFLFATGYGDGRGAGGHAAAPILQKPFDPERLIAAVEALASAEAAPHAAPWRRRSPGQLPNHGPSGLHRGSHGSGRPLVA